MSKRPVIFEPPGILVIISPFAQTFSLTSRPPPCSPSAALLSCSVTLKMLLPRTSHQAPFSGTSSSPKGVLVNYISRPSWRLRRMAPDSSIAQRHGLQRSRCSSTETVSTSEGSGGETKSRVSSPEGLASLDKRIDLLEKRMRVTDLRTMKLLRKAETCEIDLERKMAMLETKAY
ncbi:hypothetical protein B0J12DRAFT_732520 [Macrophomina phaseolina]|uniref:Uncharacterized protein n=1 Tax=Macrophomina phaseolina TaxID=35725 RepID=A0ABQ8FVF8_9PEZI|nr:hypothetical protein B0J12DRAFT_732520 [Macrophomina phaseolina]